MKRLTSQILRCAGCRVNGRSLRMATLVVLAGIAAVHSGCRQRSSAPATGAYGPAAPESQRAIASARPDISGQQPWTNSSFSVIQSELSPATLYYSTSTSLTFFAGMPERGLGPPTFLAMPTMTGPKIFTNGAAINAARLNEGWVLAWFAGAHGWTNWDSPWLVTLQRRPTSIQLGSNGLTFRFNGSAGYAACMPIYGYYKPAQIGVANDPVFQVREKKKRVLTWEWSKALPADPLSRARYWASALKEFPLYCEDTFSVDRSQDSVVLRQSVRFLSWDDDWNTRHVKLAPVSPVLAHAFDLGFPAKFSKKPFDMQIPTPYGPIFGIEGVDAYEVTFPLLKYVNETEAFERPQTNAHPSVQTALSLVRETMAAQFKDGTGFAPDQSDRAIHEAEWYARAVPYLDEPLRTAALSGLRKLFRGHLNAEPGTGNARLDVSMLQSLWAYAHFTGDWDLVKERWPLIRKMFIAPVETRWVGFGRDGVVELGDKAGPCLAMARMAYKAGDMDTYNYACVMFVRELAHLWVQQRGSPYFRENQPWHTMEPIESEVFLTHLRDNLAGWEIDGFKYPARASDHPSTRRWTRFKSEDVARFYRDHLMVGVKRELDLLQARLVEDRRRRNDPNQMPSMVQLRSLLLNETPAQLSSVAAPHTFAGPPAGIVASCLSVLRTSHPTRFERLVPGGPASSFARGIEREVPGPNVFLVQNAVVPAESERGTGTIPWPRISWWGWETGTGAPWNFGHVMSASRDRMAVEAIPLNWNTRAVIYSAPNAR